MERKLVFINRYFYPDHSATSQMLGDVSFSLSARGRDVTVITSRLRYDAATAQLPHHEIINGVNVQRVWTSKFGRSSLLGRSIDYLTFYLSAALMLWKHAGKNTTVVAKTDPPLISVVAALIVWARGAKLVNWIQDLFPEVAEALGLKLLKGPVYRFVKYHRNRSLQAADFNIVLGEVMAEHLLAQGVPSDRIRVMPNWADGDLIKPLEPQKNSIREKWGLTGKFVVGYSGNFGRAHEFNTILKAAESLKYNKEITFLFIGGGAQHHVIEKQVRDLGLGSIIFKPYQSREHLSESLSCADIHLISLNPRLEGYIVPSKTYGIMAAGRPAIFIGSNQGEVPRMLRRFDCGFSVSSGDHVGLVDRISSYSECNDLILNHSKNARLNFMSSFDKSIRVGQMIEELSKISEDN